MNRLNRRAWALALAVVSVATLALAAPPPEPAKTSPARRAATRPRVIGTQHINRYAAIEQVEKKLKADPKNLANWIILGELTHEVALDAPSDLAPAYYRKSRDAYEHALALSPKNPGLKAAVDFARASETGVREFQEARDRATQVYLDARSRDLAATGYVPTVRSTPFPPDAQAIPPRTSPAVSLLPQPARVPSPAIGEEPSPDPAAPAGAAPAISPAPRNTASTDAANFGTTQIYTSPYAMYRPLYQPQAAPYTYQQYSSGYRSPSYGLETEAGPVPMTIQRYVQQMQNDSGQPAVNPAYTLPR